MDRSDREASPLFARVADFIHRRYLDSSLTLRDIADEVHFSEARLSYLFKREMRRSMWDYVIALRIEQAKRLLATTDLNCYEIAYAVGYESPEHFGRLFKRQVGTSPSLYRSQS